jgi:hypothetical protein
MSSALNKCVLLSLCILVLFLIEKSTGALVENGANVCSKSVRSVKINNITTFVCCGYGNNLLVHVVCWSVSR